VDGVDDGGVTDRINQMRIGTDISFHLWNPDRRGLPPLPDEPPPEEPPL